MNVPSLHQQPDRIEQAFPGRGGRLTTMTLLSSLHHQQQQPDRIDYQNGRQQEPSSPRAPNSSPSGSFRNFPVQMFAVLGPGGVDDGGHHRHQQRTSPSFIGRASVVVPVVSSDGRSQGREEGRETTTGAAATTSRG